MEDFYIINLPEFSINEFHQHYDDETLSLKLDNLSKISLNELIELTFSIRECKGKGLSNKVLFYKMINWFIINKPDILLPNLKRIHAYGYWKDYLCLWRYSTYVIQNHILYIYCKQLEKDWDNFCNNDTINKISLASKWAPTEKCYFDKKYGLVKLMCEQLKWSPSQWRKRISQLRNHLLITERLLCDKRYGELDFDIITKANIKKYDNCFKKYCGQRYLKYKFN